MLNDMDKLVSLCKRRGFIFPSSEVYGGINGFWDYGPLGVELKRNIKDAWWRDNVRMRDDMVGLDCSIIMNPKVWEASGHVGGFSDPMVDCRATKERYRADQIFVFAYVYPAVNHKGEPTEAWLAGLGGTPEEAAESVEKKAAKLAKRFGQPADPPSIIPYLHLSTADREKVVGPSTDERGTLTEPRAFNLMFKTFVGALESESNVAYLRPETAQGIFANFKNVVDTGRVKLPFGIAQIGKSFRNEINPRNFTFRSREFEQMEIEFFCRPEEAQEWYAYWRKARFQWYVDLGLRSDRLRLRDHDAEELAFYSTATADIEYAFPFGISELEGIAHRGNYDLNQHMKFSGKDLSYFDEDRKERFVPHVVEPSAGADRATLAFLCEAYTEDQVGGRGADGAEVPPADRAGQGRGISAGQAGRDARDGRGDLPRSETPPECLLRREGGDRATVPPPGRGRHTVLHHRGQPEPGRRFGDIPRPRYVPAVARGRRGSRPSTRRPAGGPADPRRDLRAGA